MCTLLESVQLDRDLADVRVPTLVVTGDAALDSVVPVRLTEEYSRIWPHASASRLARTGHLGLDHAAGRVRGGGGAVRRASVSRRISGPWRGPCQRPRGRREVG